MRGRPGCPTGQEKKPVRATVSNPPFLQGKVGYQIAPSSDPASPAHLPPKGKALGVGVSLQGIQSPSVQRTRPAGHASQSSAGRSRRKRIKSCFDRLRRPKHTSHPESAGSAGAVRGASPNFGSPAQRVPKFLPFPARPAGGRAVTGVRYRAAGQAEKKRGPPQGPPNQKRWVQGGRTSSSLVFFPPAFFQRKPGPRPGPGGQRGAAPRGLVTAPTTQRVRSTLPPPARSRARTHVAGSNLRWSRRDHLSPPDGGVPGYITWKR